MALATQCPHCHTTFRVAHDQLKLRAGLVRCGACKQIFNGIENLLPPEEAEPAAGAAAVPPPAAPAAPAPEAAAQEASSENPAAALPPETSAGMATEGSDAAEAATGDTPKDDDPLLRMTLMDFTHRAQQPAPEAPPRPAAEALDPLERAIDDLQQKPWRGTKTDDPDGEADELDLADQREYEEPGFVKQGRRRQRIGRAVRLAMAIGLPLLLIVLAAQGIYAFRDQLAARFPQARPALVQACSRLGCAVRLPAQIDYVSLESSELQMLSADRNAFVLAVLLRNRSATVQAWPSLELTLNDANDKPLARRVFAPRDYLSGAQEIARGFAPQSEQPVKIYFSLSQLQPSGYRAYLFYP